MTNEWSKVLLPDGTPAQCNPEGALGPKGKFIPGPCCSPFGYCGSSPDHCECGANCIDYRKSESFQNLPLLSVYFGSGVSFWGY